MISSSWKDREKFTMNNPERERRNKLLTAVAQAPD